jgi:hypothetical protein
MCKQIVNKAWVVKRRAHNLLAELLIVPDLDLDNVLVLEVPGNAAVDRRDDISVFVRLAGRYSLPNSINPGGKLRQFACRAVNISSHELALAAPVVGDVGLAVVANIEQLGRIEGSIIRLFKLGFAMSVTANDQERRILGARIDWIEQNRHFDIPDNRAHARFIPRRPLTLLSLADGSVARCFVVDISVSGAAVSAGVTPKVGTVLAIGKVVGRVTRYFAGGFAVEFIDKQDRQEVESLVILG